MHKLIPSLLASLFIFTGVSAANSLYEYYHVRTGTFPSVFERQSQAIECGIDNYVGSFSQNIAMLRCLESETSTSEPTFGAGNPVTATDWTLATRHDSTATTLTLTHVKDIRDNLVATSSLPFKVYFMLEAENRSNAEIVVCPRSGFDQANKQFNNCTRGLSFSGSAESSDSDNQKTHPAGASANMTNVGQFFNLFGGIYDRNIWEGPQVIGTTTPNYAYFQVSTTTGRDAFVFYGGSNTSTNAHIKFISTTSPNKIHLCFNDSNCFDPSTGGDGLTVETPLIISGSELNLSTSTYWFGLEGNNLDITTSTGSGMDDFWHEKYVATTTHPGPLSIDGAVDIDGAATTTELVVGNTTPSSELATGDAFISGNATSSKSVDALEFCVNGKNCLDGFAFVATSTAASSTLSSVTNVLTETIEGGRLGKHGVIKVFADIYQNVGGTNTLDVGIGGTDECTFNLANDVSHFILQATIVNDNAENSQRISCWFFHETTTALAAAIQVETGQGSIDTSSDFTVNVTVNPAGGANVAIVTGDIIGYPNNN